MKYHIEELTGSSNWKRKGTKTFETYQRAENHAAKIGLSDDTHFYRIKGEPISLDHLTKSERRVLDLIIVGRENIDIANMMGLGLRTVEQRRQAIFKKLRVKKVATLVTKIS